MKRRIILITVLTIFVLSLSTVYAQSHGKGMGRAHGMGMGIMADEDFPELTNEQRDQMADLKIAHQKAMIPVRADLKMLRIEMKELMRDEASQSKMNRKIEEIGALKTEIKKMQLDHRLKMKDVFTDDQIEYLKNHKGMKHGMMKKFHEKRKGKMGKHPGGMHGMGFEMDDDFDDDDYSHGHGNGFMFDCPKSN
jgi:Spy/CpxP family protein refolding chaperone